MKIKCGVAISKNHLPNFLKKDWVYNVLSILLIGLLMVPLSVYASSHQLVIRGHVLYKATHNVVINPNGGTLNKVSVVKNVTHILVCVLVKVVENF